MKTKLYDEHIKLGAKIVDFAGWEMPISYSSLKEEILATRNSCGVFDVSHMGEFFVEGKDAVKFVDFLIPNNFNVPNGKAVYSPLLNKDGKIIDDLIAYKLSESRVMICVNASNIKKDWDWIYSIHEEENFDCTIVDRSEDFSLLAIQGPKSEEILKDVLDDFSKMNYYEVLENNDFIIARTGYTGEDGFEVFGNHEFIVNLWQKLMKANVLPCGLGARDTLRVEVCYPLYGHELNEELSPLDCALKWTIKSESKYVGQKALESYKSLHKLIKLSLDKGIPREGYKILSQGEVVGEVTSGTMSPNLGKGIAIGRVLREKTEGVKQYDIEIRGKTYEANYHTKPFIIGGHK